MLPLFDTVPHKRTPVVTFLLVAANVVIFGYELFLMSTDKAAFSQWVYTYSLVPSRFFAGWSDPWQWFTILSSMFLHGSIGHVLGNCWFLWIFGNNVEDRMGPVAYFFFYLFAGLCAALLQLVVAPGAHIPMLGASGAIAGVLGAYVILHPFGLVVTLVPWIVPIIPIPAFLFLGLWFFMQAYNGVGTLLAGTSDQGGVAWWAHAGGFVAGFWALRYAKREGLVKGG